MRKQITEQEVEVEVEQEVVITNNFVKGAEQGFALRTALAAFKDKQVGRWFGLVGPKKEQQPVVMSPQLQAWLNMK